MTPLQRRVACTGKRKDKTEKKHGEKHTRSIE